jgi:glycosyltransferase involved in cell wall biosynthesis
VFSISSRAAQCVLSVRPGVEFFLIGDGSDTASVRRRVCNGPGAPRIHVLGSRTTGEVALWMNAADVFCLPSHREGCPNVILEAMNCGCRVVATAVGGIPELVDSKHGTLVLPGDGRRLSIALLEALATPRSSRNANGTNRRTWDDVAAETFDVCRRAVPGYERRHRYARAAARRASAGRA